MINPIDKDKVAENPGLIAYPHNVGSAVVKPDDIGKLKSRALSAMYEQTNTQFKHLQKQAELIANRANELRRRVEISEKIYEAELSFEPFVGNAYHLYERESGYQLMMIAPDEWGVKKPINLEFVSTVRLLSDHTWEVVEGLM